MTTESIQAVDVHGHYGVYDPRGNYGNAGTAEGGGNEDGWVWQSRFFSGDLDEVVRRARMAATETTIVSPLRAIMPKRREDVAHANADAAREAAERRGIMHWVVVHPLYAESFEQAAAMIGSACCAGIKIHPESHHYPIREHGEAIFEFAARHRTVVLAHSGEPNSLPADFLVFADRYPEMKLVLAHLGMGWDGDFTHQVRAIEQSKHGNLYTDTSSARSITPKLIEWAAAEIGAERILFGTDTPLYVAAMQRTRIDCADLSAVEKRMILRENAQKLLLNRIGEHSGGEHR